MAPTTNRPSRTTGSSASCSSARRASPRRPERRCPERFLARLSAMIEFLSAVQRPDGLMPQVGDADDGRLHVLSEYGTWKPQDPRHLFGPAAGFFARDDWARGAGAWSEWEANGGASMLRARPCIRRRLRDALRHFPHAGMTVMRQARRLPAHHERHRRHRRLRQPQAQRPAELRVPRRLVRRSSSIPAATSTRRIPMPGICFEARGPTTPSASTMKSRTSSGLSGSFGCSRRHHPSTSRFDKEAMNLSIVVVNSGYGGPGTPLVHNRRSGFGWSDGALIIDDKVDGQGRHIAALAFPFRTRRDDRDGWRPMWSRSRRRTRG